MSPAAPTLLLAPVAGAKHLGAPGLVALVAALACGCAQPNKNDPAWEGLTEPTGSSATEAPQDDAGDDSPTSGGPSSTNGNADTDPTDSGTSNATDPSDSDPTTAASGPDDDGSGDESGSSTTGVPLPDPGPEIGSFQLTYYWLTDESEFDGSATETLYNPECEAIATVSPAYADALTLEGTGRLTDGRVLNYWNNCGCPNSPCFFEVDEEHPWGFGVQNRALTPYRSLAVDTDNLSIGDWVYVAELDGVMMPGDPPWGGFVHDGCVVADDIGGGINGAHIDFFAALRVHYLSLDGMLGLNNVTLHGPGERCGD